MEEAGLPCVGAEFSMENGSFVQGREEVAGMGLPPTKPRKKKRPKGLLLIEQAPWPGRRPLTSLL